MADTINLTNQTNSRDNGDNISKFDLAKWIIIFSFTSYRSSWISSYYNRILW